MSDALLTEISKKLSDIHAALKAGAAPVAAKATTAAAGTGTSPDAVKAAKEAAAKKDAATKAAAAKKAADEAAAKKAAATPSKPAGPPAGTKAPGGKRTIEQVREIIRKVASNTGLGMQSAKDILMDDGGGVEKVIELKPEFYDRVYEACEVLLNGEGDKAAPASEPEDDLM